MRIQYISNTKKKYKRIVCSTFEDYQTIDTFDATIVDLSDPEVWKTKSGVPESIDCEVALSKLGDTIKNSKKNNIVILLPVDVDYAYSEPFYAAHYCKKQKMSDCLKSLKAILVGCSFLSNSTSIKCEKNVTELKDGTKVKSDFYFVNQRDSGHLLPKTVSYKSEKMTSVYDEFANYYYTFLNISDEDLLLKFLLELGIDSDNNNTPSWLEEMNAFDDEALKEKIKECGDRIDELKKTIESNKNKISDNNYYKEMLVCSGDELVERVFKTLEELLGINLKSFVDEKGPDFVFQLNECVYVGEIKGINTNVKNANISQINVHESNYIDELEEKGKAIPTIKKLLIINHQRNKPLGEREPINDNQIKLAENNGVLIIETISLLKLLERFRNNKISKEIVIDLFGNNIGKLSID